MGAFINILICVSLVTVLACLGLGLFGMARGGQFNSDNANKFMRWRVWAQSISICLLMIGLLYNTVH